MGNENIFCIYHHLRKKYESKQSKSHYLNPTCFFILLFLRYVNAVKASTLNLWMMAITSSSPPPSPSSSLLHWFHHNMYLINPFALSHPCGCASLLPLVMSLVLMVKDHFVYYCVQSEGIFQTIPEWAKFSQRHWRKRQKTKSRWPENCHENLVPLPTYLSFRQILRS